MKTRAIVGVVSFWSILACGASDQDGGKHEVLRGSSEAVFPQSMSDNEVASSNVATATAITDAEKANLVFMWQEEKMARDVYLNLFDRWGHRVFENIAGAEKTHMAMVERLLNTYHLPIPGDASNSGMFADASLQKLYDDLMAKGNLSLKDAFEVGQMIEMKDIADLQEALLDASSEIAGVYQRLLDASYRHLAAFNRQLGQK